MHPSFLPVVFQQNQNDDDAAARQRAARDARVLARAKDLLRQLTSSRRPLPDAWDSVFEKSRVSGAVLAAAFEILNDKKQYESCVEGLQAAIRNDHAQPWMYDLLAYQMSLAGRPQSEINRVLLSRVDFTDGDEAQLLVTSSVLSRFGAHQQALDLCHEAVKRNPWQSATWLTAGRIARKSKNVDAVVWTNVGILKYVWDDAFDELQGTAKAVLEDLEERLRADGKSAKADEVAAALKQALVRDLRISVSWAGNADLDLFVTEPGSHTCSYKTPLTPNGGVLIRQAGGITDKVRRGLRTEEYICVEAPAGDYTIKIKNILGRLINGKVLVRVTRHEGTDSQKTESRFYEIGGDDYEIRVPLKRGRGQTK